MKVGRKPASRTADDVDVTGAPPQRRRGTDGSAGRAAWRKRRPRGRQRPATRGRRPRSPGRSVPAAERTHSAPGRPAGRPKTASQAKARAKARKAKAPKIRSELPLRDRLIARLAKVDLRPRALLARIPFVVLVIGSLAIGLAITLWLSTDSAQRSYQLSSAPSPQ